MTDNGPCSILDCPRPPVHSARFRNQHGHVHYCDPCAAMAREWYDVVEIVPFPCPWTCCNPADTWIDFPPELT